MFQLENSSKIKVWWTLYAINNIIAEYESKSLPLITQLFREVKIVFPVPPNPLALLPSQYTEETKEKLVTDNYESFNFTFCSHQKLKYNYNKNTKVYVSKNEKKNI